MNKRYLFRGSLALKKVLGQFSRVVGLTGTPAPNGLEDLWPQVFLLDRGVRLGRTMKSYIDMYFDTPNSWLPYKHELKPGAEEEIYRRLGDICVSMRAADHLQMPERIENVVELTLSTKEEKLYRQMERDMLLPYADGDVLALNAATLAGKLLQLSNGAVYGLLGKHPTTGQPVMSPFVGMGSTYMNQTNRLWNEIFQIVKENCAGEYDGDSPQEDVMERLLRARMGH